MIPVQQDGEDLILHLYVQPGARHNEVVGEYDNHLKVRITAPPVDNKANKHLLKFVARLFALPASRVSLIKGERQRRKQLRIQGVTTLPDVISAHLAKTN